MVVDVVDLNLTKLNLKKAYDQGRQRSAKELYNRRNVEILEVNKIRENEYDVEAEVKGNSWDYYSVNLSIEGEDITNCSCKCMDYAKGHICKHILATCMEVIDPHSASTIEGKKKLEIKRIKEMEELQRQW